PEPYSPSFLAFLQVMDIPGFLGHRGGPVLRQDRWRENRGSGGFRGYGEERKVSLVSLEHVVDHLLFRQAHQVIAARSGLREHLEPVVDVDFPGHPAAEHRHWRFDDGDLVMKGAER